MGEEKKENIEMTTQANAGSTTPTEIEIVLAHAPHIKSNTTITAIMLSVVIALFPATVFGVVSFGIPALVTILITLLATLGAEALWQKMIGKPISLKDCSALVSGLLLALNLPPSSPWWMCIIGGAFAMIIVKGMFGGLGRNPFNPALAARVFLLISFPQLMTNWSPSKLGDVDAVSGATPLALLNEIGVDPKATIEALSQKATGALTFTGFGEAGSLGETSALFLLLGGLFLLWRKIITWHIPISFLATIAIIAEATHLIAPQNYAGPVFHLCAGGAILGAFFMATDYTSSPLYPYGKIAFGAGCGLLTMAIRLWGGYPEGVSFAILIMNAIVPLFDTWFKPKTEAELADKFKAKAAMGTA